VPPWMGGVSATSEKPCVLSDQEIVRSATNRSNCFQPATIYVPGEGHDAPRIVHPSQRAVSPASIRTCRGSPAIFPKRSTSVQLTPAPMTLPGTISGRGKLNRTPSSSVWKSGSWPISSARRRSSAVGPGQLVATATRQRSTTGRNHDARNTTAVSTASGRSRSRSVMPPADNPWGNKDYGVRMSLPIESANRQSCSLRRKRYQSLQLSGLTSREVVGIRGGLPGWKSP
jgi:hypothetical protein